MFFLLLLFVNVEATIWNKKTKPGKNIKMDEVTFMGKEVHHLVNSVLMRTVQKQSNNKCG